MNIWHLIPSTNPGGNEVFAKSLIDNFPIKSNHTVFSSSNINGLIAKDFNLLSDLKKIDWNYEKFLIDSDGVPIRRYRPSIMPEVVGKDIDSFINKGKLPVRKRAELGAV